MNTTTLTRLAALTLALTLFATPALAAKKKKNTPANKDNPNVLPSSTSGGDGALTPADSSGADAQAIKANLDGAQKAVKSAQADLDAYVASRKVDFEKADPVASLLKTVTDDKTQLDALASPIRAQLTTTDSRYASAVRDLPDVQTKLDAAKAAKNADEIIYQKSEVDRLVGIVTAAESAAFAKSADYSPVKTKFDADSAKLAAAEANFPDFLNNSPDYPALKLALANATTHLNTLQNPVASK